MSMSRGTLVKHIHRIALSSSILLLSLISGCSSTPKVEAFTPLSSILGADGSAAGDPELMKQAQEFDRFLRDEMSTDESEALIDTCHAAPEQNVFCYSVLNRESLEARGRGFHIAAKPSTIVTHGGYAIHPRFRHHRVANWNELRSAAIGHLIRGMAGLRPSELDQVKRIALSETRCPNNAAIAVAATLEDQLREGLGYREIADLYRRGGDCLVGSPPDRENLLTRAGLFYYAMKDYVTAARVFARSAAIDTAFVARPLYWLYRSYQARQDAKRADEALARLQARYPFSFHTLIALTAQNKDPGEILDNPDPVLLTRSHQRPDANFLIEQTEILHRFALTSSAAKTLDWAIRASQGAEPELMLYLAELKREQGDYHSKISILSDVLYKNPALVSRETLQLYFPKVFFPVFEKQSSVIDPYLLLAVARRESAFRVTAVSGANARGLLQLLPETGRRIASRSANLLDPDTNVEVGAKYLTELLQRVGGQIHLALAAYNAGPAKLFNWTERYATADPILFVDLIPYRETREYVASVLRNYYWYRRIHKNEQRLTPKRLMQLADSRPRE